MAQPAVAVEEAAAPLRNFYLREMRPFLQSHGARHQPLSDRDRAHAAFEGLRTLLPVDLRETTKSLEAICEEERQLRRQVQLHHWLHGWLMPHSFVAGIAAAWLRACNCGIALLGSEDSCLARSVQQKNWRSALI